MKLNTWSAMPSLCALLLAGLPEAWCHPMEIRSRIPVELQALYPGILRVAEKGDWEGLLRGLETIEPIISETDKDLGLELDKEIHGAIARRDGGKTMFALQKIIAGGVKSLLLQSIGETQAAQMRRQVRQAFAEFIVIESDIKRTDFNAAQKITGGFRRAYVLAEGGHEPFAAQCRQVVEWLDGVVVRLEPKHE